MQNASVHYMPQCRGMSIYISSIQIEGLSLNSKSRCEFEFVLRGTGVRVKALEHILIGGPLITKAPLFPRGSATVYQKD